MPQMATLSYKYLLPYCNQVNTISFWVFTNYHLQECSWVFFFSKFFFFYEQCLSYIPSANGDQSWDALIWMGNIHHGVFSLNLWTQLLLFEKDFLEM